MARFSVRGIVRFQPLENGSAESAAEHNILLRNKRSFPEMKGFSPRNLKYMRAFPEAWRDEPVVQAVLAQITWYHNVAILEKLTTSEERLWYAKATIQHGWSRNVLVHQIEAGRMHRQGKAVANFDRTLPVLPCDCPWGKWSGPARPWSALFNTSEDRSPW